MKIEDLVCKYLNDLLIYFKENGIDEANLYQKMVDLKVEEDYEIDVYANYDKEKNILKYNPSFNNGKRNVIGHECLHIAGGFENNRGFNEFVTQYLNTILFGNKRGYFNDFDYELIDIFSKTIGIEKVIRYYFERDTHSMINEIVETFGDNRGKNDGFDFLFTCDELYDMNLNPFFSKKSFIEAQEKLLTILGVSKQDYSIIMKIKKI